MEGIKQGMQSLSVDANSGAITPTPAGAAADQIVTPWDVQGAQGEDGKLAAIDYSKLIENFGTRRIEPAMIERLERLTGQRAHPFLRRGLFFSHR